MSFQGYLDQMGERSTPSRPPTQHPPAPPTGRMATSSPPGGAVSVAVIPAPPPQPVLPQKLSQPDATYVPAGPAPFLCGACVMFTAEGARCQLVDGQVDAKGSCRFFYPIPPGMGLRGKEEGKGVQEVGQVAGAGHPSTPPPPKPTNPKPPATPKQEEDGWGDMEAPPESPGKSQGKPGGQEGWG